MHSASLAAFPVKDLSLYFGRSENRSYLQVATDPPLWAADEAALVAVQVDGVGLNEEEVLVSLK